MKGNHLIVLEELVKEVGLVVMCPSCHGYEVRAFDESGERMAYARATELWKSGSFGRMEREQVIRLVEDQINAYPHECPAC